MTLPRIIKYTIILLVISIYAQNAPCRESVIEMPRPLPIQLAANAKCDYLRGIFHCNDYEQYVLDSLRSEKYAAKIIEIVNNKALYKGDAISDTIIIIDNSYTKDFSEIFVITDRVITNKVSADGNIEIFKYPNNKSVVQQIIDDYERKYNQYNSDSSLINIASEFKIVNDSIVQRIIDDYEKKYCRLDSAYTCISIASEVIIANDSIISVDICQYPPLNPFFRWNLATDVQRGRLKIDAPILWRHRSPKKFPTCNFWETLYGKKVPKPFKVKIQSLPDSINIAF